MNERNPLGLLISDFTIRALADFLRNGDIDPAVETVVSPFNQVSRSLLDPEMECWSQRPDFVVVWTRPESVSEGFAALLQGEHPATDEIHREVDEFAAMLRQAAERTNTVFVPAWTLPHYHRGLGLLSMRPGLGSSYTLMQMNLRLADALESIPNIYILDAARWMVSAGRRSSNPKLWYMAKVPFGLEVFRQASAEIKAGLRGVRGQSKKLVILDLDDTLWGGIVGDAGWENLALGGHSPVGEAFQAFQRELKTLANRGVMLAIVSKNDESVALEAIELHPEMVLRQSDFVGWRINWRDKAENIASLVAELNIGLDAVVFIDDHPLERSRVQAALPEVLTPDWPLDKTEYVTALHQLQCFDVAAVTSEDRIRTQAYAVERARSTAKDSMASVADWLGTLDLRVEVEPLAQANLSRTVQLLNKTNQMNLATRRMGEAEFWAWASAQNRQVNVFRVSDRFGSYGLTGVASLEQEGEQSRIIDFVLSCRVMGRGVEQAMLSVLAAQADSRYSHKLIAQLLPTERNRPCLEFFERGSGYTVGHEAEFTWPLDREYPPPSHITLISSVSGASPMLSASAPGALRQV